MQHLFGASELLSGHTNGAQMRGAIPLASARHFEEQADPMLAPAVGVAIWEHFEDALEADGAEEVLAGGLVLAVPALRPRTSTILDHCQEFLGVRRLLRTSSRQICEVLHVGHILGDQVISWQLIRQVVVHPLCGLRRDSGEKRLLQKGILLSGRLFELPRLGLRDGC